jgi:hypothetical protein
MKLNKKTGNVTQSGDLGERAFSVAATAQAFDILSSRLYTDTKLAIVRELSTNASDAHVDAGNPNQPFDVHLPVLKEPYFEIRDYGTGLSHEDAMTVYTTFFDSTRNDSDEFTGALGLGSKSPFAYTDAFLVTSYYGGMMRSYSAFRNDAGLPSFALMSESTTNEPNGLKIRIDIKGEDCYDFIAAAEKVYPWFKVAPNFIGEDLVCNKAIPIMNGEHWEIYKSGFNHSIRVVMGNVAYSASPSKFITSLGNYGHLTLYVPIGTCGIAANREELHYDDKTLRNIQAAIDNAMRQAQAYVTAALDQSPTLFAKVCDSKKFREVLNIKGISDSIESSKKDAYILANAHTTGSKLFIRRDSYSCTITPSHASTYTFIENDVDELKQKHRNALRHWIDARGGRFYLATIQSRTVFKDTFGKPEIKLSEIPPAPRKQSVGSAGGPRCSIKRLTSSYRKSDIWRSSEVKDVDPTNSIAVRRNGYNIEFCDRVMSAQVILEIAESLGYDHVYGLPSSRYDKPRKQLKLKDLETEARIAMAKFSNSATVAEIASLQHNADQYYCFDSEYLEGIENLGETCINLVDFIRDKKPSVWTRLLGMFKIALKEVEDPAQAFWKKYPLLRGVDDITTETTEYIKWKNLSS